MTIRTAKTLLASALLFPAFCYAGDLSYSYLEAGYGQTEIDLDGDNIDGDTLWLAGSLAVAPNWHVFADYAQSDFDFDVDLAQIRVGGGYNHSISDTADVIARVSYVSAELDTPFGDADEDGFGLGVGLRAQVIPSLELEGAVDYVDLGGDDSGDTSFRGDARYFITPMFAVGAAVQVDDDVTTYGVTARFNFR